MMAVDSATSRSASSIRPRPISTRPKRPAGVDWREMNSTTPTKMNSGDSHDRSSENTTDIRLVPMSAPSITASAVGRATRPWPTKEETIRAVAVLDCTSAVTPRPASAAAGRVSMLRASTWRRLAPKTRRMPVRTRYVPQTSSATAASRFSRCFMFEAMIRRREAVMAACDSGCRRQRLAAAHPQQLVQDQADRARS